MSKKNHLGTLIAKRRNAFAVLLGLVVAVYIPNLFWLARGLWSLDQQGHSPIVLLLAIYLLWERLGGNNFKSNITGDVSSSGRLLCLFAGVVSIVLIVIGRSQGVESLVVISIPIVFAAAIYLLYGTPALVASSAPILFMILAVPLPGFVVDSITQPMKLAVSVVVEWILLLTAMPVARSGVVLSLGQYQLLVADACAGLQTLFTLEALGLFYLMVTKSQSSLRNVLMAIFVVPISFMANVIRVIVLCLVTYYFGDAAGQGFVHSFAGIVLFLSALTLLIGVDSVVRKFVQAGIGG